jgi:hypothetical protein
MKTRLFYGPATDLAGAAAPALAGEPAPALAPAPPAEPAFELPPGYALEAEPGSGGPTSAQLKADYEKALAENAQLKARTDSTAAFTGALGEFKSGLEKLAARPIQVQAQIPQPAHDPEADDKAVDDNFLESPTKNIRKILGREITPALELTIKSNISTAKALVRERPAESQIFAQYGPEIDAELAKIPLRELVEAPVEGIERALAVVKGRHLEEIFTARQAAAQAAPAAASVAPVAAPRPLPQGGLLPGSPNAPREDSLKGIKPAELATVKAYMANNGTPSDKFDAVLACVRDGSIR